MDSPKWDSTTPLMQAGKTQEQGDTPTWDTTVDPEERYGGTTGALKAFGLGAARSASFGGSDEALVRLGAMKAQDIKGYKEQNPIATPVGEAAGVLGAMVAPETGILGALSAPVRAVSELGGAATEAVLPAAKRIAGAIANPATSPVINKILAQAGAHAVGSAVEGAAYGMGQNVTEHALGDPDLNGEKILANIGTGAIWGTVLGSVFGGIKGGIQAKFPKFISEVDKAAIDTGDWEAIAKNSDLTESEKNGFIEGLQKKKANAPDIEAAAKDLDAPVLPGMISDNKLVQKGQSALLEGPPTISSIKAQQVAAQGYEKAEMAAQSTLGAETDITKAGLGDTLKDMVTQSVEKQSEPINALYDEIKTNFKSIPANLEEISQVADDIKNLEDIPFSDQAESIAKSAVDKIKNIKTVDDIKRFKSLLNQSLGLSSTPLQKRITAIISDKLANLEENSIVNFAKKEMAAGNFAEKDKIMSLLDQREAANAQYTVFKDKLQRMGETLGRKRVHGAGDFVDFVESLTPEKIADKLSGKNNSEFLNWFSKEFPEGMTSISQYKKGLIRDASMKDGHLNINRMLSEVDKMPKEYREKIFSPDELKKINSIKTYTEAFPKNFNPSNTENASAFRKSFENVLGVPGSGWIIANSRDFAIQNFISAASHGGDMSKKFIDGLSTIERTASKTTRSISSGVSSIFSSESSGPGKAYLAISADEKHENHDKISSKVSDLTANPEKLIDHLNENTEAMSQFAPKTAASIQGTAARATQFLQSKLPGKDVQQKPLSQKYKPSPAELAKWHNYFSAVDNPTAVLKHVANGTIVPETMEALSVVYPKLLSEMQSAVTSKMTESISKEKLIHYKTKLSLSLFLGSDMVNSLDPKSMLANQNMLSTATMAQQQGNMSSGSKKSLDKMDKSNRFLTAAQTSAQRQEA